MPLLAGRVLLPDRTEEGWIRAEGGRIVDAALEPPPERPDGEGWLVPAAVNAHTHAGDTCLRAVDGRPRDVAGLVGPGGWKHRMLRDAEPATVQAGIERLAEEMAAAGTAAAIDFREGGAHGLALVEGLELPLSMRWYGRPRRNDFDEAEAEELLTRVDGIGLSARRDFPRPRDVEQWADACRDARKPLALHVSEAVREDMGAVTALGPAFVVHACKATRRDLETLADEDVAVVVCPRSNRGFRLRPPVEAMLDAGLRVAVGTDNGMLHDGDVWKDLGQLQAWAPGVPTDALLRMATYEARRLAGLDDPSLRPGTTADWLLLPDPPLPRAASGRPVLAPVDAAAPALPTASGPPRGEDA